MEQFRLKDCFLLCPSIVAPLALCSLGRSDEVQSSDELFEFVLLDGCYIDPGIVLVTMDVVPAWPNLHTVHIVFLLLIARTCRIIRSQLAIDLFYER